MKTEFEAKFVGIDIGSFRRLLESSSAVQRQEMRLMKRAIFDNSSMKRKNSFIRIRDEGDKITLTYKQFDDLSVSGAKEYEVVVNDFETTVSIFKSSGLHCKSFQESKRETWSFGDVEIVIDIWPWLDPYVEIEGDSEVSVREVAKRLGLNWAEAVFGDVMAAYRLKYPHLSIDDTIGNVASVRFNDPLPDLLKE